jgi:prepilin-type N-terminal cleavage/methylation domain-containing protein/prepilin-type processing-associated H-X9-DG protein
MKKNRTRQTNVGFTLVELLVVITIIAALASVAFTLGPKMKRRGEAAKSIQNMRQIGAMVGIYSADNSLKLPASQVKLDPPGGIGDVIWHEALLYLAYPDVDKSKIKWDIPWWNSTQPFMRNPVMTATSKPRAFKPWFCGYAYNYQITARLGGYDDNFSPSLASFPEPARSPLVAPFSNRFYKASDLAGADMKAFLVDNKMPVLFVDGHVENMSPSEYISRKLDDMPKKP